MVSILHELEPVLLAQPTLCAAAAVLPVSPPLITWVDDLSIPVPCLTAADLDEQVVLLLGQVRTIMASYDLQLNTKAGKTELVCQYHGHGTGAALCRHRRFIEHAGQLPLPDGTLLHVVGQYQHLGTTFSQSLVLYGLRLMVALVKTLLPFGRRLDHAIAWTFFGWGQFTLPDLIDATEDPDFQLCLGRRFFEASKLFEISDLHC